MSTVARRTTKGWLDPAGGSMAGVPKRRHLNAVVVGVVGAVIVWLYAFDSSPALAQATQSRARTASAHRAAVHAAHHRHRSPQTRHWPGCKPKTPRFEVCDSPTKGLTMGGAAQDALQSLLISFAKDQLKGFILNQFGVNEMTDPVGTKLAEISRQLGDISTQVTTVQTSINNTYKAVVNTDLHTALNPLVTVVGQVFSLYEDRFAPALRGEIAYATANKEAVDHKSTCDATANCVSARNDFFGTSQSPGYRSEFLAAQGGDKYIDLNDTIHDYLVPFFDRPSIVTTFGTYLIANSDGFLTRATSDRLLAFYRYFADAEALATWMKAEYRAVGWGPDDKGNVTPSHQDEFRRFIARTIAGDPDATPAVESYFHKELSILPELIPAHAVISLSPNAAERTTAKDRPMWLYDPLYVGANSSWLPTKQALRDGRAEFEDTSDFSVGHALKRVDDAKPGDFSDWTVPTWDEWKGLFAGWNTTKNLREFLGDMDPTDPYWHSLLPLTLYTQGERLWTRTPATVDSKCLPDRSVLHLRVPTAVNTSEAVSSYNGALGEMGPGAELYGSGASACYDHAWAILNGQVTGRSVPTAQLIVRRNTGSVDYMATQ